MIDPEQASWARQQMAPGGVLQGARGLRDGGAPWLLSASGVDGEEVEAVLRVGPSGDPGDILVESAALRFARLSGLPVPAVIGVRPDSDPALLLIERVRGSSDIPTERDPRRLETLGGLSAGLSLLAPPTGFERRSRTISGVDFAELRREAAPQPLLQRGEALVESYTPASGDGLVHGDLWQGNTLWDDGELVGVIDWDCAGVGPAGIDLGSLRLDGALCFGIRAADDVLRGWENVAGVASDLAYWDVVAALCTPPEIDWFGEATRAQGRPDLSQEILRARRDEFLEDAIARLS